MAKPVTSMKVALVAEFLNLFTPDDDIAIDKVQGTNVLVVRTENGDHLLRFEKKKVEKP